MAINVSFNGATIFKPGAYSKTTIDLGGGFPLSPTGLVAIFGESDRGTPGNKELDIKNNVFSPEQLPAVRAKYGSGAIVDACSFLFAPGADAAIPSGAQAVYIYKTNASTRSELDIALSYGTVQSLEYGVGANRITFKNVLIPETPASRSSSSDITFPYTVTLASNDTLTYAVNGGAVLTATIAAAVYANATTLAAAVHSAITGDGLACAAAVTPNRITISQAAGSNIHRNGWGRTFEIVNGNGRAGLNIAIGMQSAAVEPMAALTNSQKRDLIDESATVGGNIVMSLGFNGAGPASVAVSDTAVTIIGNAITTVFDKAGFSALSQLVAAINLIAGWTSSLGNTLYGQLPLSVLDHISATGALSASGAKPARLKKDAYDVQQFFALSSMVSLQDAADVGLPDAQSEAPLAGAVLGATGTADVVDALEKFTKLHLNSVVPLFARDATADISDGLTDASSAYTIAGIHQAVKTHCSLMATTKKKSERQGYLALKDTYVNCKNQSQTLADARQQLVIQDIRQIDSQGNIKWFLPWAGAALLAGARGGSPIGTPMTFKFLNASGIRHTAQPLSTPEADILADFDPDTQYDDAIQNGITFLEHPQTGGFRIVLDNTTYGKDANFVFNRANVLYAADVIAYDFRNQLENIFVGVKNTVKAAEVKSTCESILAGFLAQGITVSTTDAPNGFKQLTVAINGNTINIGVVVKIVEGIDFILADITIQRAQSSA
jgi:hypothetical protein